MNPENNNEQPVPTTVGGVTFGGGVAPAETPVNDTTQNTQAGFAPGLPVDPIVQATGGEFDAVMNGSNKASIQDFNRAPIPNGLNTQVVSPTHFDTQNTVKPIVIDPGNSQMNMQPKEEPKKPINYEKQIKKFSTLSIVFGILTAVVTIVAVLAFVLFINRESEIANLNTDLKNKSDIISAIEEQTGTTISGPDNIPAYTPTQGYIYLSTWGIKIKVPDNLDKVSYILNENYHQSICFNAVGKGVQIFPDFANVALNPGRMGCLTRILTNEGNFDAATGISYGTKVFTYKDYSYFYTDPIDYSKKADELGLEHTADQIIKDMLRDNVQPYE
jgi:cell division protein FtsL